MPMRVLHRHLVVLRGLLVVVVAVVVRWTMRIRRMRKTEIRPHLRWQAVRVLLVRLPLLLRELLGLV